MTGPALDPDRWRRLEEHFVSALDLGPAERAAHLARLAASDAALADEVLAMLQADAQPLSVEGGLLAPEPPGSLAGQRVGPYRVLEPIGRGGMGEVYLAERDDQYRQRVALKVVRTGLGGAELRSRFRVERQVLARLGHPGIARILDGGVTEDGRDYLVMEHIQGVPVTEWCDARQLAIDARLRLFLTACEAVGFAHRNLVVHRDLKPSNILVTEAGELKLLDFGIAKLLEPDPAIGQVADTRTGLGRMTPEHAAPEQIRGEVITTVTDVYALGVLLYELLCGRKPHALGASLANLLRDVCERDTAPPSAAAFGAPADVATARGTTVPRLHRLLGGDLDAIAQKALRKEPEQRFASAEQLAEDVRRHLGGLPVLARRGTFAYRAGRFLRRHAAGVGAAALFAMLLAGSAVVTWNQSRALARERDRARAERDTAEQVVQVLVGLFELSDPTKVPGGDALTVRELLARNEAEILRQLDSQPAVRARVQRTLGEMYLARSDLEPAARHLQAALEQHVALAGERSAEAVAVHHQLALLARRRGSADAVPMLRRSLAWYEELNGPESVSAAMVLQDLADALPPAEAQERVRLLRRALELRRRLLPPGHPDVAASLHALAVHHLEAGRHAKAEPLLVEARAGLEAHGERGPEHPHTLAVMGDLASVYIRTARLAEAETLHREVLARQTRVFGAESATVANTLNSLATTQAHRGDLAGAERSYSRVRELYQKLLGPTHWHTANAARNLARVIELQGRYAEALPWLRDAYEIARQRGDDGGRMAAVMGGQLGALLARTGTRTEGLAMLRRALRELDAIFPGGHPHVADTAVVLARTLSSPGIPADLVEAEKLARRAIEMRSTQLAPEHPKLAEARCVLGIVLAAAGRDSEAEPLLRNALPALEAWGVADKADLAEARRRLKSLL